jgi:hypothetical protein
MISDEALMGYLDGQADAERTREIDAALGSDPALRDRLARLEASDAGVRAAFGTMLDQPVPHRLVEAVRAGRMADGPKVVPFQPRPKPARPGGPFGRLAAAAGAAWAASPPWLGLAVAGQAGLIVLAAILLRGPLQPHTPAPQYETLGAHTPPTTANLMVMFKPATSEQDLRGALRAADARIVGGPTAADAYLLYVLPAQRSTALERLRARAEVTLAEPLDAPGAPR